DSESFDHVLIRPLSIAIIDHTLAWSDGMTMLTRLKQAHPNAPVIMFSDSTSQTLAIEAMKAGLDDFVLKAPRPEQLRALRSAVPAALDRAAKKQLDETIHRRLEEAVRNERNTFEALVNSQPGVVFMVERQGLMLRWNKQLEEVTGYSSAELAAMNP